MFDLEVDETDLIPLSIETKRFVLPSSLSLTHVAKGRVSNRQMRIWAECTTKTHVESVDDRRYMFLVSERLQLI